MANFCGKCGYALDPATGTCPNCNPAPVAEAKSKNKPDKPKSKKKILIPIIAAVLVLALLAGGAVFLLPKILGSKDFITTNRDGLYFANKHGEYYMSAKGLISTENSEVLSPYGYASYSKRCIVVDNVAYLVMGDDTRICSVTLDDKLKNNEELEWEPWLDFNDCSEEEFLALRCSWDWQYYDGYIYFYVTNLREYSAIMTDTLYQLMRINIDTKEIEVVNDNISVSSYVIYKDWIYYYDNGYDRSANYDSAFRGSKAGLYRIKLDGSNKEKLLTHPDHNEEYFSQVSSSEQAYSRLGVYDDKLYYIDNTDVWDSRLYRMDLDGDNVERISNKATYEYTIDTDTGKLYYVTGSFNRTNDEVKHIYEVSLKNLDNEKIAEYAMGGDRFLITAKGGIVSLHSIDQLFGQHSNYWGTEDNPCISGLLIDTKDKKITALYNYSTYRIERIDAGRGTIIENQVLDKTYYYWDEYDGELLELK